MTSNTFSQTALPPVVRVCNTADAPFSVSAGSNPNPPAVTVRVIDVREVQRDTQVLPEPQVRATVKRGHRVRVRRPTTRRRR